MRWRYGEWIDAAADEGTDESGTGKFFLSVPQYTECIGRTKGRAILPLIYI